MPDRDNMPSPDVQLRDHLQQLYRNALSQVRAPGVALVRRSARRRMATHATAVVVLVAALVVAALAQPWLLRAEGTPAAPPTSTATPAPTTPRPSTSASPTTPPATQSASATSSATPSAGPGAAPSGGGDASPGQDNCERQGVIDVTELMNFGYVTVSVRLPAEHPDWALLLCPGEKVRVFWASYTVDPAGVQHLYRYEERVLDEATPTWRMYIDMKSEGLCGPTWYVSSGGDAIPTTIPLGTTVFPRKVHWDDQNAKPGCDPTPNPS